MKRIFLLFLFLQLWKPIVALAQFNASQIKKDGVTIKGNASNQLMVDTATVSTKWYAASVGGGGGGSGTVTSVATGYGLSGGTITTTGTLIADTSSGTGLVSKDRLTNSLATKQSLITTGTTLQYFRGDLSLATFPTGLISSSDTATMLSPYLRSAAASTTYVPQSTTVNGHALSGNVTVTPTDLSLVIGTNVQAYDADLTTYAGITPSANVQTLLGSADYSAFRSSLGLGTAATQSIGTFLQTANNLSDVTASTARTNLGLGTLATQSGTFSGTSSGTNTGDQTITLTGNVTGSGTGSFATTIANSAVTNAMLAGSIDLTTKVTGALPIANGGTASTTAAGARASLLTMFTVVMVNTVGTLVQNTTYYFGAQGNAATSVANRRFKKIPFACTLRGATVTMTSSNSPSTENNTVVLSINNGGTNLTLTSTFASSGANCSSSVYTGFSQAIGAGDTIEIKYTTNATLATAPANCGLVVDLYFE